MDMQSLLPALKAFDETARLGSMSAAARALGLQQPTLSAHIGKIERSFGVELFYRRGRRLELTPFGHSLLECTQRAFRAETDALAMLTAARGHLGGVLRLCAVGPYNVIPMIKSFRQRHPEVHVRVSVSDSKRIVEQVIDYQGDVGVLVHGLEDPDLVCLPYRRQALVIFASVHHPLAARERLRIEDLHRQEFVLREEGSTTRSVVTAAMQAAGVQIRCCVEMGSRESVREAVAQGLGLGVVAEPAYVSDARLRRLEIAGFDAHTHVHVICRKDRQFVPLIRSFVDIVKQMRN